MIFAAIFLGLLGGLIFAIGYADRDKIRRFEAQGKQAIGRVLSVKQLVKATNKGFGTYVIQVAFQPHGRKNEFAADYRTNLPALYLKYQKNIGQPVKLLYMPDTPFRVMLEEDFRYEKRKVVGLWAFAFVCFATGAFLGLNFIF